MIPRSRLLATAAELSAVATMMLATACSSTSPSSPSAGGTRSGPTGATAAPKSGTGVPKGGTAGCTATCYAPRQLEAAYGVRPLLQRGIDGRGETVVLPELAESPGSPEVSDLRQDFAAFDQLFHLPAPHLT